MMLRKALLGLCLFLVSAGAAAQDVIPLPVDGETYYAAYPITINVDGDFSEWTSEVMAPVTTGPQIPANPQALSSLLFAAAADTNNLYLSIQVIDPHIIANQHGVEYWQEDSVEVYINASGNLSLTEYTPSVAQINIPAANIGRPIDQTVFAGINWEQTGTGAVVVQTSAGYAIEAAIPLQNGLWNITPTANGSIGFQIQLNGASQLDRDLKLSWSKDDQTADQSYANPSVFGELVFFQTTSGSVIPTLVPPVATNPPAATDQSRPAGNFSVSGSRILDPMGNPFVAKGVNISGFNWVWQRHSASDVNQIVDCWNFNLVRVNSFLFWGRVPYQQYEVNNNLDEIVNTFTSRGIVVVFEGHDHIGSYYQGEDLNALIAWFTELASRYRDNPYVWFDIMNEPGNRSSIDRDRWVNMHGQVIEAIRNNAQSDNIIIVEGAFGGQDNAYASADMVTQSAILQHAQEVINYNGQYYENIAFSIHPYDLWNQGDAKMADYFDRVHAQGMAMIVGEYGVDTGQDVTAATQSMFNTAVPRSIGRIVWHWDGSDNNDLTSGTSQGGGWEINDCANPTNLSWLGQLVWNDNHS